MGVRNGYENMVCLLRVSLHRKFWEVVAFVGGCLGKF